MNRRLVAVAVAALSLSACKDDAPPAAATPQQRVPGPSMPSRQRIDPSALRNAEPVLKPRAGSAAGQELTPATPPADPPKATP